MRSSNRSSSTALAALAAGALEVGGRRHARTRQIGSTPKRSRYASRAAWAAVAGDPPGPGGAPPARSWCSATFAVDGPDRFWSPTCPTSGAGRAWSSSPSSSTPTRGVSSAGSSRATCTTLVLDALGMTLGQRRPGRRRRARAPRRPRLAIHELRLHPDLGRPRRARLGRFGRRRLRHSVKNAALDAVGLSLTRAYDSAFRHGGRWCLGVDLSAWSGGVEQRTDRSGRRDLIGALPSTM